MSNRDDVVETRAACPPLSVRPGRAVVASWRQLNTLHTHIRTILSEAIEPHGLSIVEYEVLDILEEQTLRHLRMQDVATVAGLSTSATTRLVNRLEERGLLVRILCAGDRRGIYAELTDFGKDLIRRARPGHEEALRATFHDQNVREALNVVVSGTHPD